MHLSRVPRSLSPVRRRRWDNNARRPRAKRTPTRADPRYIYLRHGRETTTATISGKRPPLAFRVRPQYRKSNSGGGGRGGMRELRRFRSSSRRQTRRDKEERESVRAKERASERDNNRDASHYLRSLFCETLRFTATAIFD